MVPPFGAYHGFLDSGLLQIGKLLKQGFPVAQLTSSLYLSQGKRKITKGKTTIHKTLYRKLMKELLEPH
jgi:hypothetical protein